MEHADEPVVGRIAARWGHYGAELLIVAVAASIFIGLYPPPGFYLLGAAVGLLSFVVVSWLFMRKHDRRLCEACMAAMPLNPAEQAARYKRRFWTAHTGSEPRFLLPYAAVLIGSNFATTTVGRIGWALVQSSMIYLILAQVTHRRLQPWCPWCRGGGEEVLDPPEVLPRDDRLLV